MKRLLIGGALFVSVFGFSSSVSIAQGKTEQELIQIENDWCTAEVKRDTAMLGRIMADDCTGVVS